MRFSYPRSNPSVGMMSVLTRAGSGRARARPQFQSLSRDDERSDIVLH